MVSKPLNFGMDVNYAYDALNRLRYVHKDQTAPKDCTGTLVWRATHEFDVGASSKGWWNKLNDLSGNAVREYDARGQVTKETKTINARVEGRS